MQVIQLYIEGQRVDMFKDESVTITNTLKNVKEIDKIFTEFSRTFSVPASSVNNLIFKHFYNNDIVGGFDARLRVKSNIELNSLPFKNGYIKLEGVNLKDNKAHTYRITFFGDTISLKNLLGDDLLSNLDWLNNFNDKENGDSIVYKSSDVEDYLTNSYNKTVDSVSYVKPVQIPLLTHTQRLFYDSSLDVLNDGNLKYTSSSNYHGVKWKELKYAIKLEIIIKAIEDKYNIVFSTDFFSSNVDTNTYFDDLYMWLHRTKGVATNGGQVTSATVPFTGWADATNTFSTMSNNTLTLLDSGNQVAVIDFVPASSDVYSITFYRNNIAVIATGDISGNSSYSMPTTLGKPSQTVEYTVEITSVNSITFTSATWTVTHSSATEVYINTSFTKTTEFELIITQQVPKMKVLDFLTSIFKMFNLVAYVDNDVIVVKTLDSFYVGGSSYDITKYIDVSKSQSNAALPFREINFTYTGLGTFLAEQHDQLYNQEWGTIEYKQDETLRFSGGVYDYKIPFEHMKFERLIDINVPTTTTDIQWGFCVNGNQESYLGKPIILYMANKTADISFVDSVNYLNNAESTKEITSYFAPCNSNMNVSTFANQESLNFDAEQDEWSGVTNNNTLFKDYHSNFITSIFNDSNRISRVTAYLPLRILLNYTLADRFQLLDKSYKINSIKTNYKTGKSEIELLNDI